MTQLLVYMLRALGEQSESGLAWLSALVNHVRLERATKMLLTGHNSIEQVGKNVGFSSRSHFSQAFKKHTGVSPVSYKNG
jgi:AraC-like DNA-binding protein